MVRAHRCSEQIVFCAFFRPRRLRPISTLRNYLRERETFIRESGRLLLCSKIYFGLRGARAPLKPKFGAGAVGGADAAPHAPGHFRTLGTPPPPHLEALPRACSHSHRHPSPIAILAGRGRAALPLPKCCAREGSWLTCCCFLAGSQGSEATASSLSRAGLRGDRLSDRPKKWAAHLREQARVVTRARSRSSPQAALGVAC